MAEERFQKITSAVYKLLEFFPSEDPLKNKTKEKALEIMEKLISVFGTEGWASLQKDRVQNCLLDDIDILLGYLNIAKNQGWLNPINYLIISNEYEKIKKEISPSIELTKKLPGLDILKIPVQTTQTAPVSVLNNMVAKEEAPESFIKDLSDRQKKILKILEEREKTQVADIIKVLPDVTKRTIRRDLDDLLKKGKITRVGEWNQVFYKLMNSANSEAKT